MDRCIGISKVSDYLGRLSIRFLCLRKDLDISRVRAIIQQVPYPCWDIFSLIPFLDKQEFCILGYEGNIDYSFPIVISDCTTIPYRSITESKCRELLNIYNPYILNSRSECLCSDIEYKGGWLVRGGTPLCHWKSSFNDVLFKSHFVMQDNICVYKYERPIYMLTDTNVRHIQSSLGEVLSINLQSLDCVKNVKFIDKTNHYIVTNMIFDRVIRDWVTISTTEPITVLGRKWR